MNARIGQMSVPVQRAVHGRGHRFHVLLDPEERVDPARLLDRIAQHLAEEEVLGLEAAVPSQVVLDLVDVLDEVVEHGLVVRAVGRLAAPLEHLGLRGQDLAQVPAHEQHLVVVALERQVLEQWRDDLHHPSPGLREPGRVVALAQVLDRLELEVALGIVLVRGADVVLEKVHASRL
ncbi:MAG: hypothetical protein JRG91_20550 [Deltaproteobacteria bacterium]|nr:hypothetical protein [Deltaproteobacteria bacterium]